MGQQLARHKHTCDRKWFSRGWDLTPVRAPKHLDYLIEKYLPEHETVPGGLFKRHS